MSDVPEPPPEQVSLDLVARLQDGDRDAFEELYRRYHDQLLLVVRMRLGPGLRRWLQSEDIFQSVARDALTALPRFEYRGPGSLDRYLKTMVLNKIRDRADTFGARKRSGGVPLTEAHLDSIAAEDEPRYLDDARFGRLERCLRALPDDLREVLVLRKVEGLSSREVAERTGRSDAAVRKACSRALAKLTLLMTDGDGAPD